MMFITVATIRPRPPLVDDREIGFEALRQRARPHHAADVGRYHHQVLVAVLPHVAQQDRPRVDVVHRDIEKTLDLLRVQVHRQHAVHAGARHHVGHDFRRDRHARRARAPVLPRITHIRDRRGHPPGRSALQRIDHDEQLHQVVVGRRAQRLQHEHVLAANVLEDLDHDFAVAETAHLRTAQRQVQMTRHHLGELGVGVPAEHHQPIERHVFPHSKMAL